MADSTLVHAGAKPCYSLDFFMFSGDFPLSFFANSCFLSFYGKTDKKGDLSFVPDSLFAW